MLAYYMPSGPESLATDVEVATTIVTISIGSVAIIVMGDIMHYASSLC